MADFDLTIIGGGVNGTAIARDAAGRGLRVLLVEQHDLASGTSWTSTKLIHGGLRYLESGAFHMVFEALQERARLLQMAPHIIWPMRFILPHHKGLRPAWQLRFGLFLYDLLAGKNLLPKTTYVHLANDDVGAPLNPNYKTAFEYSDCCVDDVRLVVLNAVDAAAKGAIIATRTGFEHAVRENDIWRVSLSKNGHVHTITAKALVNAAGPWVENVNGVMPHDIPRLSVKRVKGSHIVVPKLFDHPKSYIFQNKDGRIVFAIPYQDDFTLIGTTEENFSGNPVKAKISDSEIAYLCDVANGYFKKTISPADVIWHFAGIRALYDDKADKKNPKDISRDYRLKLNTDKGRAPFLSIYGGKLTSARSLAEKVLEQLAPFLPMSGAWTATAPFPGGDFPWQAFDKHVEMARRQWPFLTASHARRLVRAYGTRIALIVGNAKNYDELGSCFGADLYEREVIYLIQREWAIKADDILWRRSKLGLRLTQDQQENLAAFMAQEMIRQNEGAA